MELKKEIIPILSLSKSNKDKVNLRNRKFKLSEIPTKSIPSNDVKLRPEYIYKSNSKLYENKQLDKLYDKTINKKKLTSTYFRRFCNLLKVKDKDYFKKRKKLVLNSDKNNEELMISDPKSLEIKKFLNYDFGMSKNENIKNYFSELNSNNSLEDSFDSHENNNIISNLESNKLQGNLNHDANLFKFLTTTEIVKVPQFKMIEENALKKKFKNKEIEKLIDELPIKSNIKKVEEKMKIIENQRNRFSLKKFKSFNMFEYDRNKFKKENKDSNDIEKRLEYFENRRNETLFKIMNRVNRERSVETKKTINPIK